MEPALVSIVFFSIFLSAAITVAATSTWFSKVLGHKQKEFNNQINELLATNETLRTDARLGRERFERVAEHLADSGAKAGAAEEKANRLEFEKNALRLSLDRITGYKEELERDKSALERHIAQLEERVAGMCKTAELEKDKSANFANELEEKLEVARSERLDMGRKLAALQEQEPLRIQRHTELTEQLNSALFAVNAERNREREAREHAAAEKLQHAKEAWAKHEADVREKMTIICQRHGIDLIAKEKFPLSGKPDNCVKIANEFVVFDSKSPDNDDYRSFPSYVRRQAEAAQKYAKHAEVKKDIYFVVPQNAIHAISETFLSQGTYRVHVISVDSLTAILMSLKKIEDYEFAKTLSPDDREKIITTIGKMAHGMKRSIQINQHISKEFFATLAGLETLPNEVVTEVKKIEIGLKLNAPIEGRAKSIDLSALKTEGEMLAARIDGQIVDSFASKKVLVTA